ncbi:MAG TPA: hypothetical protein VL176_09550 [Steroidobacteraceae bacterium]|nr:hypothetical protein [Steroidobacteraceae bacterium]
MAITSAAKLRIPIVIMGGLLAAAGAKTLINRLNHIAFATADAQGLRLAGQENLPKIGRDAKWQLNLIDPDGTRAEIMEFHAVGRPCCSPFTASDPRQ